LLRHEVADIHLLGNAVDPETFCPGPPDPALQAKLGITPDGHELVLGFCGELRQKKGFPFLLRALETVHQVRPAKLVVIGEVRPREKIALDEFIADVPDLKEHLILAGHQEEPNEVARHLRICDLLLHPSVWDGLPNALLESMACGKLVLASDAGGIPEVIEHGTNGCLLPRAELPRLGEAILELDRLPHSPKTALESAARESIRQGYSPAHEREKLQQVLRDLLKNTS
ncbi:MAG: glycosyltransferase family 4 protein, partial [Verrucomicrobiota bacterium]